MEKKKMWVQLAVTLVVLVTLDLWTKHLVSANFQRGQTLSVIDGFFQLTLVHNTGSAFGLGAKWGSWFFIAASFVAIGVVFYLLSRLSEKEYLTKWGLILILAGAFGNLVDRIRLGYVVDFLDVYVKNWHWPAFNVADSCISVGACLFAIDLLFARKPKDK